MIIVERAIRPRHDQAVQDDHKADRIRRFYDQEYHGRDAVETVSPRYWSRLAARLAISRSHRVLDVACGRGGWLAAVADRGACAVGVDFSERAVKAAARDTPDARFCCASAEALPLPPGRFDVVTCFGSLEHFVDADCALLEMRRVAVVDARFLFVVPNSRFLGTRLRLFRGTKQSRVREEPRTLRQWAALFERAGLQVERRWADLHVVSWQWICAAPPPRRAWRILEAATIAALPLEWQYQVCFLCRARSATAQSSAQ